jgi:transcriptional regulator with XRE-family HTH domain
VVARNVAGERARARWTQADLAERLGVSPATVSTWEVGKRVIGMDWLPPLCRALEVSLADLVRGADPDDLRAMGLL